MKNTINTLKRKVIIWGVAITLALIPLSAFANYMVQPVEQKPMSYTVCENGKCKVVAEITPPPLLRYEVVAKEAFSKKAEKYVPLTKEEQQRRDEAGKEYVKQYAKYAADGEVTAIERFMMVVGL